MLWSDDCSKPAPEIEALLDERVALGVELQTKAIQTEKDVRDARADVQRWSDFNAELLASIVNDDSPASHH